MKRRFALAPVLRVRRLQEQAAQVEAASKSRIAAEQMDLARERADQARQALATGTYDSATFRASLAAARSMSSDATAARALAQVRANESADADTARQDAARRVKGLERLEERHRADVQAEEDRAATAATDDLVSGRHAVARAHTRNEEGFTR
jgi:flagellar biosynthesis chaperone FliJ